MRAHALPALLISAYLGYSSQPPLMHCWLQDTPGTDVEGAEEAIKRHITQQQMRHYHDEADPQRACAMHLLPDARVDVCICLLPPHALKPDSLRLMAELTALVPVIPVLAKVGSLQLCGG